MLSTRQLDYYQGNSGRTLLNLLLHAYLGMFDPSCYP